MKNKEVIDHIVNWLKQYNEQSKTNGFVIGISGGVDSALTSTLCAKPGKQVICLNMPIRQQQAEYNRGVEHIRWLCKNYPNVLANEVDLTQLFTSVETTLPENIQDWLTMANTRARLRMLTLYAFACNKKMLVVGTGNKVEDFWRWFFYKIW